jgi:DNA polymerase-3 subunit delta
LENQRRRIFQWILKKWSARLVLEGEILIYILHGKDLFRRQLRLNQIKSQYLSPGLEAFCYSEFQNPALVDFCSAVKTPGFGMGTKVILIKDFQYLESKSDDESHIEIILNTLQDIPAGTVLVFYSEKINGTIKLVKNLKTKIKDLNLEEFALFNAWKAQEAGNWLADYHREQVKLGTLGGPAIDRDVAELIAEQVGLEDSGKLYSELIRLIALGKPITRELVLEECRGRHDVFALARKLAEQDRSGACFELKRIIENKELHLGLIAVLDTTISRYLKLKLALEKRLSEAEQSRVTGISPKALFYQKQDIRKMQSSHLQKILSELTNLERAVKTGKQDLERGLRILAQN